MLTPEVMTFITANVSRVSTTVLVCVLAGMFMNTALIAFLSYSRRSKVKEFNDSGRCVRELEIIDQDNVSMFVQKARATTRASRGDF
jgi:hypothetical protein